MEDKTIPRQTVPVSVSLSDGRIINGEIQIDLDLRLSDYMNGTQKFIIIKDVDHTLKLVNKDHIVDVHLK